MNVPQMVNSIRRVAGLSHDSDRTAHRDLVYQGYQHHPVPWPKDGITNTKPFRYLKSRWVWRLYGIFEWMTSGLEELAIELEALEEEKSHRHPGR